MTTEETLRKMYHVACDRADALSARVAQLQTELAETRRIVAEWLYGANSGWDGDPGTLQNIFEQSGRTLDPELDVISESYGES